MSFQPHHPLQYPFLTLTLPHNPTLHMPLPALWKTLGIAISLTYSFVCFTLNDACQLCGLYKQLFGFSFYANLQNAFHVCLFFLIFSDSLHDVSF